MLCFCESHACLPSDVCHCGAVLLLQHCSCFSHPGDGDHYHGDHDSGDYDRGNHDQSDHYHGDHDVTVYMMSDADAGRTDG